MANATSNGQYKYLDFDGLELYDNKMKEYFDESEISLESIQELCNTNLVSDGEAISDAINYVLNKPV